MPGLFDSLMGNLGTDDPQKAAYLALASGLLAGKGNFGQVAGQAMMGSQEAFQNAKKMQQQAELQRAQMQEYAAQSALRQAQAKKLEDAATRQAQFSQALNPTPVSGIQAASLGGGPTPQNQAMIGYQPKIDFYALARQFPELTDEIKKVSEAQNFGRTKVARTAEVAGPDGRPVFVQLDDYGGKVGSDLPKAVEAKMLNLGGTTTGIDPYVALGKTFQHTMTPEGKDASLRGWASHGLAKERLAMDRAGEIKPPVGYRWAANGKTLEAIPGGPADKKTDKNLTEDQGKATSWLERMDQAEAIIRKAPVEALQSTGSLGGMAGAAFGSLPFVGDSGAGKFARNLAESPERQSVRNAQEVWVQGLLRSDTGAAYKDMEKSDIIRAFFWQPGESEAVRREKDEMRDGVRRAMAVRAGPGIDRLSKIPSTVDAGKSILDQADAILGGK